MAPSLLGSLLQSALSVEGVEAAGAQAGTANVAVELFPRALACRGEAAKPGSPEGKSARRAPEQSSRESSVASEAHLHADDGLGPSTAEKKRLRLQDQTRRKAARQESGAKDADVTSTVRV